MTTLTWMDGNNVTPVFDDIERLSLDHPIIYHCVTLHRRGAITQEECLLLCVLGLAAQNIHIKDRLMQAISQSVVPHHKP